MLFGTDSDKLSKKKMYLSFFYSDTERWLNLYLMKWWINAIFDVLFCLYGEMVNPSTFFPPLGSAFPMESSSLAFLLRTAGNILSNVLVFLLFLAVNFRQLNNKWISRKFSSLIWQCFFIFYFCLILCVCVCAQLCPTLGDPMDCSPPGSAANGVFQARILEWVALSSSRGISLTQDWTCVSCVSCIGNRILYHCTT